MNTLTARVPVVEDKAARVLYLAVCWFSLVVWFMVRDGWYAGAEWIAMLGLWAKPWEPYKETEDATP